MNNSRTNQGLQMHNENTELKKGVRGATLVEYALLVALIAVLCIVAMTALGRTVSRQFSQIASAM